MAMIGRICICAVLLLAGCVNSRDASSLPLWRDGKNAKSALVNYVQAVTRASSPDYIPPESRIAIFDFDGTLFCETAPTYFDWMLFEYRVLDDPRYSPDVEQTAAARLGRDSGRWPGLSFERERMVARAWRGLTPGQLAEYVRRFAQSPQPGFTGMKRGEAFYRPMTELVRFLKDNGFVVYVSSGTDRFVVRPVVEDALNLPPRQIIGSDGTLAAKSQNGKDGLDYVFTQSDSLVLGGDSMVKNLQMNKVATIVREIGEHPVLAFGNSSSDASMLNYTLQNPRYKALAFMVLCDDTTREYGDISKAEKMRQASEKNGWIPISMRDDWTAIYAPGVEKNN